MWPRRVAIVDRSGSPTTPTDRLSPLERRQKIKVREIGMMNLGYNIRRLVQLERVAAAP
jgi:hypothetical protein